MKFGKITLKLVLPLLFIGQNSLAQWLYSPVSQSVTIQNTSKAKIAATPLKLPFFDDFSLAKNGQPDPTLWLPKGGVFVNNVYPVNHPSVNVATFDGLRNNGFPYVPSNQSSEGSTDSLISQVIDLSKYVSKDSVFISFYWQNSGLGEKPDPNDSLRLQFRTNGDIWNTVWVKKGDVSADSSFTQELISIRAGIYLHENFQFKFESFGQQSGQFDAWHIDYVMLNKKPKRARTPPPSNDYERFVKDVAIRKTPSNLLKNYTAMPLKQFLKNPSTELLANITTDYTYLSYDNDNIKYAYSIKNTLTNKLYEQDSIIENINYATRNNSSFASKTVIGKTPLAKDLPIANNVNRAILKSTFSAKTSGNANPEIPEINFTRNDTISTTTVLDDYYAYDDGSAEIGAYIPRGFARVATKFTTNQVDSVSAIRIKFAPSLKSIENQEIIIQLMDADKDGNPGKILLQKLTKIQYSDTSKINFIGKNEGFINFDITKDIRRVVGELAQIINTPIPVPAVFFIGYSQSSDNEPVIIGLDKNNPQFSENSYYNIGNGWAINKNVAGNSVRAVKGSLMMRPVMSGKIIEKTKLEKLVLANESEIIGNTLVISPNPSDGMIRWNEPLLKDAEIMDLSGKTIFQKHTENQEIDASHLNSGLYLLKLSNQKNTFVRKIIIK